MLPLLCTLFIGLVCMEVCKISYCFDTATLVCCCFEIGYCNGSKTVNADQMENKTSQKTAKCQCPMGIEDSL